MKYQKTVNVWVSDVAKIKQLQPGQWVEAGGNKGRYWGVKKSGTIVVAWEGNARKGNDYWGYQKTLQQFARG